MKSSIKAVRAIHEIATLYQHWTSSNSDNGASVWCFALKWCSGGAKKRQLFRPALFYQALQQNPAFRFIWHISCKSNSRIFLFHVNVTEAP